MADPNDVLAQARNLLREGKVQHADNLISDHFKQLAAGGAAVPETAAAPAPERPPQTIVHDLFTEIVALLGNKDSLVNLLNELRAVI